jgi:hypothetical protein
VYFDNDSYRKFFGVLKYFVLIPSVLFGNILAIRNIYSNVISNTFTLKKILFILPVVLMGVCLIYAFLPLVKAILIERFY